MRRLRFGSAVAAVAIATAGMIPILAAPAGAATTCGTSGSMFPALAPSQSGWKVACTTDALTKIDNVVFADTSTASWHHGAARTVVATLANAGTTLTVTAPLAPAVGALTAADVRRPVSGTCISGGAFITAVSGNVATLSKANAASGCAAGTTVTIEHSTSRTLTDASCTGGVITSASAKFDASDIGKSVAGGPFIVGSRITAVTATTATVKLAAGTAGATVACTAPDVLQIGGAYYATATAAAPSWATNDAWSFALANNATGLQGFTCSGSALGLTASGVGLANTQSMLPLLNSSYVGLKVVVAGTTTVTSTVTAATATGLTLSAACPAGISATAGKAAVGQPGANAPRVGNTMFQLGALLNLDPSLVTTADDCTRNTTEGFAVIGSWENPMNSAGNALGYTATAVLGAATQPGASVGQVYIPTAVVAFAGFIRPQRTGGLTVVPAGSHFEYVMPTLPTGLSVCKTGTPPVPANATALTFNFAPQVLTQAPSVPTGSGNVSDVTVRSLGPVVGAVNGAFQIRDATTVKGSGNLPTCAVAATTAAAAFNCGIG